MAETEYPVHRGGPRLGRGNLDSRGHDPPLLLSSRPDFYEVKLKKKIFNMLIMLPFRLQANIKDKFYLVGSTPDLYPYVKL